MSRARSLVWTLLASTLLALSTLACDPRKGTPAPAGSAAPSSEDAETRGEDALRLEEQTLLASTDFKHASAVDLGADPTRIASVAGVGYVVLAAGRNELVLFDHALHELGRVAAPPLASDVAVSPEGAVFVSSAGSPRVLAYHVEGDRLVPHPELAVDLPDVVGVTAIAISSRTVYGVSHDDAKLVHASLVGVRLSGSAAQVAAGPHRLALTGRHLVVASLEGHALTVYPRAEDGSLGEPQIARVDGPFWAISAVEDDAGTLFVAASLPEDAKLDRRGGSFAHIDSFVDIYRLAPGAGELERWTTIDVGDHGVVVPKALALSIEGAGLALDVTSGGTAASLRVTLPTRAGGPTPAIEERPGVPGISAMVREDGRLVATDPLLDALVTLASDGVHSYPIEADRTDPERDLAHLGEALVFTSLMAPWQSSEGELSRFTCETCHFEGGVDGRTHATGRGDTTATTKPLFGLFNNAPHFTRALDEDSAETVYAEFRVAGAKSHGSTWFSLADAKATWLADAPWSLRVDGSPEGLRRGLLHYLRATTYPSNPRTLQHARSFTGLERRGAEVFSDRCESCHASRLVTSDVATRVPPSEWESLVLSPESPIVWARDGWEKTGVEPYVHENGARPSSLRRIAERTPYFTNGGAQSLEDVLDHMAFVNGSFFHAGAPLGAERLTASDKHALLAFLALL